MHKACSDTPTRRAARSIKVCLSLLVIVGLSQPALAFPGELDSSFSGDGKVTTVMPTNMGDYAVAQAVVIQPDGKIVAAGQHGGNTIERFALARYNINGGLDQPFGPSNNGKVTTTFGSLAGARSVALQANGKIVVVGWKVSGNNTRFALVRYKANGNLDNSFGPSNNGRVVTSIGTSSNAAAVAIQSNGKIVVAGNAQVGNWSRFALARYHNTGILDNSFGPNGNGKVHTAVGTDSQASSLAIQSNGMIVAAGYSSGGSTSDFAVARYQTTGILDNGFGLGGNGKLVTPFGSPSIAGASSVKIQPSGEIVVAGYSGTGSASRFALARYLAAGGLDLTFSGDGMTTTTMGPYSQATSLAIQPSNGRIVLAGNARQAGKNIFAIAGYDPVTGGLDTTFGNAGRVKTLIAGSSWAHSIAVRPANSKLVVAGQALTGNKMRFALARYLP